MEQYKRFSHTVFPNEAFGVTGYDELFDKVLNDKIEAWAAEMKASHPSFRYRIINAANSDPWARTGRSIDTPVTATVHVAYEIKGT